MCRFPIFLIAVFSALSVLLAQDRVPAALNQLTGSGMEQGEAVALTNALRGELTRTGVFDMMERSQVNEILAEQGFQLSGACSDDSCLIEVGQLLAVKYMFMGHVGRVGATYSVSVRQIDVESGRVVQDITQNHRGDIDDLLTDVVPSVAQKIAGLDNPVVQRRRLWPWFAGGVVATAIPVILFLNSSKDSEINMESSELIIEWQ
ncbi:hypothetical protein CHISP_2112 [Chitinispirillum alkaliphilum]|nr:hypothetical protein CHISP_2112 [Chitinispirillum alkaliphilum]